MKTKFLITSLLLIFLTSCSSDNDNNSDNGNEAPTEFLPLKNNNYWTYDVDSDLSSSTNPLTRDSIYVANDTLINSVTYKKLKTLNVPTGFFSSTLRNNGIKIDGSKLLMTGNFSFDFGLTSPISLNVTDFIFFKEKQLKTEKMGFYYSIWKMNNKISRGLALTLTGMILNLVDIKNTEPGEKFDSLAYAFGPGVGIFFILACILLLVIPKKYISLFKNDINKK